MRYKREVSFVAVEVLGPKFRIDSRLLMNKVFGLFAKPNIDFVFCLAPVAIFRRVLAVSDGDGWIGEFGQKPVVCDL
jgi:hypothetical protein